MAENATKLPEKAELLERLRSAGFNVPPFIYMTPEDFARQRFDALETFLAEHCDGYKVIARSAHAEEHRFKSGTFDSIGTYADVGGIRYARKKMIRMAQTTKRLSILRQQHFNHAPQIDLEQMGVIVMPFIEGMSIMAKMISQHWEFGYCRNRSRKIQKEPYITQIPHDRNLLQVSQKIEETLGFRCEIEYIFSNQGEIFVVQAKDISHVEMLDPRESQRSVRLDGIRRVRKRHNYRERPLYVIDNRSFYIKLIGLCEDLLSGSGADRPGLADPIRAIEDYEADMERFALRHERFAVLGISIQEAEDLFQIASHYLDETPELHTPLAKALNDLQYRIDIFIAEADTMIAKDRLRINLGSHDAYGINTVRYPVWSVYWQVERHEAVVREFIRLGFKTGDLVGIEIDAEGVPIVFRL
jgi:hypothetical protein